MESVIGTLQSLVGYFDLDPNRVLDLVLEAYEHNQDNASYLRIIARFPRASLAHLTGFKFKYQYGAASEADPKGPRPAGPAQPSQSLYLLAARLIKHKFITIEDLYPHLQPEDSLAAEEYAKRFEKSSSSSTTPSVTTSSSSSAPAPGLLGIAPPGIVRLPDTHTATANVSQPSPPEQTGTRNARPGRRYRSAGAGGDDHHHPDDGRVERRRGREGEPKAGPRRGPAGHQRLGRRRGPADPSRQNRPRLPPAGTHPPPSANANNPPV